MPLNLTAVTHGELCLGSRWEIAEEDDLARKIALLALGQYRHVAAIFAGIDKQDPATRADTAAGACHRLLPGLRHLPALLCRVIRRPNFNKSFCRVPA
jgi:hypothetical protein